jgi:DNA-directed RNA polymerase specialized sigma24 family protein
VSTNPTPSGRCAPSAAFDTLDDFRRAAVEHQPDPAAAARQLASEHHLTPRDIAKILGLSEHAVSQLLRDTAASSPRPQGNL